MSFVHAFEKTASVEEMSSPELAYKAGKHYKKALTHEHSPVLAGSAGLAAGSVAAAGLKASKKMSTPVAIAMGLGGGAVGAGAGKLLKSHHQKKVRKYTSELADRGVLGVPVGDGNIRWQIKKNRR